MAQYFTDFSEYTSEAQPSDWTRRFGTGTWTAEDDAGATGGKVLRQVGPTNFDFLAWDAIDADVDRDDSEVLFRARFTTAGGTNTEIRALHRGSNTSGRTGYVNGLRPGTTSANSSYLNAGSFTDIQATNPGGLPSADQWFWVRSRVVGTTIQLRFWLDGNAEPGTWTFENTDATVAGAGWIGLYSNRDQLIEVDVYGVGTNGDAAPDEAVSTDPAAALTGTLADGATEAAIGAGGETLIVTLTNDTWVADDGTFAAQRQAIIDGFDSAQSETTGWNAEVRDKAAVTEVVRTSDTVVTWTLGAQAGYAITCTIPAAALVTSSDPVVADETFDILFGEFITSEMTWSALVEAGTIDVFVTNATELVTNAFTWSASVSSAITTNVTAALSWGASLAADAPTVLQRIATSTLEWGANFLGTASGVPSVSSGAELIRSGADMVRSGAEMIRSFIRDIVRRY
jgi:hypothetical protein